MLRYLIIKEKKNKMNKNSIIILTILIMSLTSCASIKEGLGGRKQNNSDEFLVQKKSPLVVPPDFEKLPTPGSDEEEIEENVENEKLSIQDMISSGSNDTKKNQSIEEFILGQIKKD